MQAYQKKEGTKHRISPRSARTRSQKKSGSESVPNDHSDSVNKTDVTMAEQVNDNLSPLERLEVMMATMCTNIKEINGKVTSMQADLTVMKENQDSNYNKLNDKLADCQRENEDLKLQLSRAVDRIDTLEQCYGNTYNNMERVKKEKRANNIIIRGVPEKDNERMHETMNELLGPLKGEVTYVQTDGAARLGPRDKGQSRGRRQLDEQMLLICRKCQY